MKHKEKTENKKALPRFLGSLLLSMVMGGAVGVATATVSTTALPGKLARFFQTGLIRMAPWAMPVMAVVLLGIGTGLLRSADKLFRAWDGEEEASIEKAELRLSWGLLFAAINMVLAFFFFGIGSQATGAGDKRILLLVFFLLSLGGSVVLQQKIVDLTRKINPEKRGSIYDRKFKEKWLESCDENERQQIGQAAFKAMGTVNTTCIVVWAVLVVLTAFFDIGVLPFFLVTLIFGVSQVSYTLESVRLGRRGK